MSTTDKNSTTTDIYGNRDTTNMSVKDRYTASHEREVIDCPSCGAKDIAFPIHSHGKIECSKCYVAPTKPGLGELTDKYIREGLTEDDAFRQAQEDRY